MGDCLQHPLERSIIYPSRVFGAADHLKVCVAKREQQESESGCGQEADRDLSPKKHPRKCPGILK